MNDFNKGIEFAFDFIRNNIKGHNIGGTLKGAVTRQELEILHKKIPKKCDLCTKPCEQEWCPTNNLSLNKLKESDIIKLIEQEIHPCNSCYKEQREKTANRIWKVLKNENN